MAEEDENKIRIPRVVLKKLELASDLRFCSGVSIEEATIRQRIHVRGIVQGVGFRPFVFRLAERYRLTGFVKNDKGGVEIEAQGVVRAVAEFISAVPVEAPSMARVHDISVETIPLNKEKDFAIHESKTRTIRKAAITPDVATCDSCVEEILDVSTRRFAHPFANCSHCGPRFTIVTSVPYDRQRTTMAGFEMCPECRAEYTSPMDRRFHAQAIACRQCGPHLQMLDANGNELDVRDGITAAAERAKAGQIGGLKGIGGFQLFCDATNEVTVRELRRRKLRDQKPFAVMMRDRESVSKFCHLDEKESQLLLSPHRPIVLLRRRVGTPIAESVAPENPFLGVILPNTPLHHLLMAGTRSPLVMTSGNRSDEPIVFRDEEVSSKLSGIVDFFLTHNRRIQCRCDDSVIRPLGDNPILARRARGYAPTRIRLPFTCAVPVLSFGGQSKATFALGQDGEAVPSQHLGDLDDYETYREYKQAIAHYQNLFDFTPELLAHDLHPDYASTRLALERAEVFGTRVVAVQHHHAHMASCMAENQVAEPVIGVCLDGAGLGRDGAIWGGEFLVGDYHGFTRGAHLRYVRMIGGEKAIYEPWRMAAAYLLDAGIEPRDFLVEIPQKDLQTIKQMLARKINAPPTSSCGRFFDAVSAILGIRLRTSYEGEAAMKLEWLALDAEDSGFYEFSFDHGESTIVDTRPIIRKICHDFHNGIPKRIIARKFHSTMVVIIRKVSSLLRHKSKINIVALSGGVFMNAILLQETMNSLRADGFRVLIQTQMPPNDGGLSLGQLAVAAHQ